MFGSTSTRYLGGGTYGETWLFTGVGGPRAAKILNDPDFARSPRLLREIESLKRGVSAHVVRLLEIQVVTLSVGQRAVLIFEYVDGGDLMDRIRTRDWPNPAQLVAFATGTLRGIAALHGREVVHRDLKPENLALRAGGWDSPVILDLGLGRLLDSSTITYYPQPVGTAPYMPPEIIEGKPARKGADLWSLGVVLYLLATQEHPFYRDPAERLSPEDALDRLTSGPPAMPETVPETLRGILERFLTPAVYRRGSARRALQELEGQTSG